MDTTIDQQVAMDEALVPHAKRLRIRRSNFRLLSDIKSKESTLQLVYDVLRLTPFFMAFLVTADVLKIYMQEFWVTATVHHHSIRFKMDNKKHIEEILAFLHFLGHSEAIRRLTDVNINKLHQPWRCFAAIINKCLTEKSSCYDSLRLSQAQILWGLYHKRNVDFAYPMWEDFVYQVEHKDTKKSNEMYYPRFTKVIIHHFMSKDPSIPRRNKTHISQASGSSADEGTSSIPWVPDVPTDKSEEEIFWNSTDEEGDDDEGKGGDDDDDGEEGNDDDDQEDEGDDEEKGNDDEQVSDEEELIHASLNTHAEEEPREEESFDPILKTPEDTDDEGNGEENLGLNVGREEGHDEEEEEDELYRDVNINQGRGIQTTQEIEDSHVTLTPVNPDGQQQSSSVSSQFRMTEAVKVAVQIQSDRLQDEAQAENDEFLKTINENIQKIIKEQVKEQVKVQVSKILSTIEQTVNEQLEAEVLTQSSNSSKTSYAVAADLSEMELKKILIEKMESNKRRTLRWIRPGVQETHRWKGARVSKRSTGTATRSTQGSKSRQTSASESATVEEPMQTTFMMKEPAHPEFEIGADDQPIVESF
nr:hypothetical protein [Tanacetum cinerariifolium]